LQEAIETAFRNVVLADEMEFPSGALDQAIQIGLNDAIQSSPGSDELALDPEILTRSVAEAVQLSTIDTTEMARKVGDAVQQALTISTAAAPRTSGSPPANIPPTIPSN
jgi:hypothetical protein